MKSLTFKIEAEDLELRKLVRLFAEATGWNQQSELNRKQHCNQKLLEYFFNVIEDYSKEQEAFKGRNKALTEVNTLKTATKLIADLEAE